MTEIKVHILHTGKVRVDKALPFGGEVKSWNPIAYTGIGRSMKHQIWVPVSCYLIEHPKGKVLIDTGWNTAMRGNQRKHLGLLHYLINKGDLPEGKAIHEQLAAMGIKPEELDYVMLSHLHSDHADGLKHVQNAKKIMVSEDEWIGAKEDPKRYVKKEWEGVNVDTFKFSKTGIGPKKCSFDLFGDGTVVFVHTPGHSVGLAATIIKNKEKFVLLTSDVGYAKKSWERLIMPGVRVNKKDVMESLKWVQQQAQSPNCVEAIANHDADIVPHTITL
jgi:N-acyl homoserine lactone hydrolase